MIVKVVTFAGESNRVSIRFDKAIRTYVGSVVNPHSYIACNERANLWHMVNAFALFFRTVKSPKITQGIRFGKRG